VIRLARTKPLGAAAGLLLLVILALAVGGEWVAPYAYDEADIFTRLKPSSAAHWLGTDNLGRDVLSRVVYGARVSMAVGLGAVTLGLLGALLVGLITGYAGGLLDATVQRVVDAFMCFPLLLVALTIMALLGPGLANVVLTLGLVLAVRDSARALGAPHARIIRRHVLPNIAAPLLILVTVNLGGVILVEAALSFLGFGVPPPRPSWGGMLSTAGVVHMLRAPWLAFWPGVALSLTVFSANMLGDALRDILDPRLRGS
jgi:peptide/nickel transport system permease protein